MTIKTVLRLTTALAIGLFVASCQDEMQSTFGGGPDKATRPLNSKLLALMDEKGMRKEDPILVRAFKQESTLEIWKRDRTGRFALLKSYQMCAWGGTLGPKIKEGDKQSPEGFYTVTPSRMNPHSQFYLAYDVGYPNAFDRAFGRTGAAVMVHGNCTGSAGCFVMNDEQIQEIYGLAREAFAGGQKTFQVQAFPFRMTAENLAKNRKNPNMAFWKNIKQGYDHFEVTKLEPKVDVCDRKYVFDAQTTDPNSTAFNPAGACPTYQVPSEIKTAVAAKEVDDEKAFKVAVADLEDQARAADERARKLEERAIADAREKSRPQPGTKIATWLGAKPADGGSEDGVVADYSAAGMPVAVPLPKASPRSFGPTRVATVQTSSNETTGTLAAAAPSAPAAAPLFGFMSTQPVSAPAAPAGSEERPPLWKRINPFGG